MLICASYISIYTIYTMWVNDSRYSSLTHKFRCLKTAQIFVCLIRRRFSYSSCTGGRGHVSLMLLTPTHMRLPGLYSAARWQSWGPSLICNVLFVYCYFFTLFTTLFVWQVRCFQNKMNYTTNKQPMMIMWVWLLYFTETLRFRVSFVPAKHFLYLFFIPIILRLL